jgi:hypothetical protein
MYRRTTEMLEAQVQLYRSSMLCDLLTEALEELREEQKITDELAYKVLDGFDHSCLEALTNRAEAKSTLQVHGCSPVTPSQVAVV